MLPWLPLPLGETVVINITTLTTVTIYITTLITTVLPKSVNYWIYHNRKNKGNQPHHAIKWIYVTL